MPEMTDIEPLPERVDRIEHKLDALSASVDALSASVDRRFEEVDKRFDEVDKRFDEVSEHFVEQRQYTEFAFDTLRKEMVERLTRVEGLIDANTSGIARIERRLGRFESKFDEFLESQWQSGPGRRQRARRVQKKR